MKLVDILARELKVWPEGYKALTMSRVDFEVYCLPNEKYEGDEESLTPWFFVSERHTESQPYPVVTRPQWQAAVDALKPHAWNGEGLPSEKTQVEIKLGKDWTKAWVIGYWRGEVTLGYEYESREYVEARAVSELRPIRTAEQIAAEKREAGIKEMAEFLGSIAGDDWIAARELYDAGYRKQANQ